MLITVAGHADSEEFNRNSATDLSNHFWAN